MSGGGAALQQAFGVAAGELGMCSASWLFAREVAAAGGEGALERLGDEMGREFPVLDAVVRSYQAGARAPASDPHGVLAACAEAKRLVVVGLETAFLDELVPRLPGVRIALVTESAFDVDWERVIQNYGGRVEATSLADFQTWAGRGSVLLTFAYGVDQETAHVSPTWLRVNGADVRTQFRTLVAWNVMSTPLYLYPRWLAAAPLNHFSHVVSV